MRGRLRDFPARSASVRQGGRISTFYVIAVGHAHAIVYSLDGQIVLLHEYPGGDFLGVVSPPYPAINPAMIASRHLAGQDFTISADCRRATFENGRARAPDYLQPE